ncbi:unnamed protein product [Linum trigynum]|uniref:RNase H type-1 domain-containing protein n=1 Tax=Linum trigynum TaxID=586398 RepID=A0AAV2FC57_9ROSI
MSRRAGQRIARGVWDLAGLDAIRVAVCQLSLDAAWHHIFFNSQLSKVQVGEVVFLVWRIWKGRCWSVHDHVQYLPPALHRQFRVQVEEWQDASSSQPREQTARRLPSVSHPSVSNPPGGLLLRFDGAFNRATGGSVGFVGYAEGSSLVCAYGKFYPGLNDPFLAELLALRDAMLWCVNHGYYNVCFCGDSQLVTRRATENEVHHESGGAILEEIRLLKSSFFFIKFVFAPRRTNRAAHLVAKTALASAARHSVDCRYLLFNPL